MHSIFSQRESKHKKFTMKLSKKTSEKSLVKSI